MFNDVIEIGSKRFLTARALAKQLGITLATLRVWHLDQDLPLVKVGNQRFVDIEDFDKWFDSQKS